MLKTILSISGKPGLFKLISQAKNMLIVESLQTGKRQPAYAHEKIISLGDIAIFTDEEDVPLSEVLNAIKEKENGAKVTLDIKKADNETLRAYLAEVLPNFDRERVYPTDIKKLISWYNLLVETGNTDFVEEEKPQKDADVENTAATDDSVNLQTTNFPPDRPASEGDRPPAKLGSGTLAALPALRYRVSQNRFRFYLPFRILR